MSVEDILLRRRRAEIEQELQEKKKELEEAKKEAEDARKEVEQKKEARKKEKQNLLDAESAEEREERDAKAEYKAAKIAFKRGQEEARIREEAEKAAVRAMGQKAAAAVEIPYDAEKETEKQKHLEELARLKDTLLIAANRYFDAYRARVDADEKHAYVEASTKVEAKAKIFFSTISRAKSTP